METGRKLKAVILPNPAEPVPNRSAPLQPAQVSKRYGAGGRWLKRRATSAASYGIFCGFRARFQ